MPGTEITVKVNVPGDEAKENPEKVDPDQLVDLDKASYPELHLQGTELPFTEEDVGKEVKITGTVRLRSIKYQGYNYNFDLTKIAFQGRDIDKGTVKGRKRTKAKKQGGR